MTLHGGVASKMAAVRYLFWIPVLRKLTKYIIQNCYGYKRFRAMNCHPNSKIRHLPRVRTEQNVPFEIVGTDYASHCIISLKVKRILKYTSYYFSVVLAELYI